MGECREYSEGRLKGLRLRLNDLADQLDTLIGWGWEMGSGAAQGRRILTVGNGGSAAQADHFVAELVGRFRSDRQPISAINLLSDAVTVTALANDFEFHQAAARAVDAHARPGDSLLCLSTSGASPNIVAAAQEGRRLDVRVFALTGKSDTPLGEMADHVLTLEGGDVASTQELHLVALHVLCDAIERAVTAERGRHVRA